MTTNTETKVNQKRGRKPVFTDEECLKVYNQTNSVDEAIDQLFTLAQSFSEERKNTWNKWYVSKTRPQLKLFVSMKFSSLRKSNASLTKKFKPGPKTESSAKAWLDSLNDILVKDTNEELPEEDNHINVEVAE